MKIGVLTVILGDKNLEEALKYLKSIGVAAVEIGCGGYPGTAHANAVEFLKDESKIAAFKATIDKYGMTLSALSVHGNPVHPDKAVAESFHQQFEAAVLVAEKLGIDTVVTFSGCPGDHAGAKYPNWVTCAWPEDFGKILQYQWDDVLVPYWKKTVAFANAHGVTKIALEMHPGFAVYNPATLLKLRAAVGDTIGANFDPSHLFWQGIDPVAAIRALKGAIYHFHAKDTYVDPYRTAINGVLDTGSFANGDARSWQFRTVGYGHGEETWRGIVSELRSIGYDHVMSIEHEDALMTSKEGLEKAVSFLDRLVIKEARNENVFWA